MLKPKLFTYHTFGVMGLLALTYLAPVRAVEPRLAGSFQGEEAIIPARPGRVTINAKDGMPLVEIPKGWFWMGADDSSGGDYGPRHKVRLDTYRIAKQEVTVAQFRKYCKASGYTFDWVKRKPSWGYVDNLPMVNVTWEEALAYCKWAGGDLPTEAEWEKAARGTDGRDFPWQGKWDATKCVNSVGKTKVSRPLPAGSKAGGASAFGVLDMAGNVSEWCKDVYDSTYYAQSPKENPLNDKGDDAIIRGGYWQMNEIEYFRCFSRVGSNRDNTQYSNIGIRPVFR